jgi:YD repeat-containing protein
MMTNSSTDYDADDRLTAVGSTSYTHDDNGNLTAVGNDSFSWDAADRLTSATVSGTTTTFGYNGDGLRDSLTTGGNTTTFTWDINRSSAQVLDDGSFNYIYGIDRIAQVSGSTTTTTSRTRWAP